MGLFINKPLVPNRLNLGAFKNSLFKTCLCCVWMNLGYCYRPGQSSTSCVASLTWPPWRGKSLSLLAALRICRCVPQSAPSAS